MISKLERILILTQTFNSLTQKVYLYLIEQGFNVSIEFDISDDVTKEAIALFSPELIIAPYLKRRVPKEVWEKIPTLIFHPGVVGDRGPSSLDWAILEGSEKFGVTILEAREELDGGPIWDYEEFFLDLSDKTKTYTKSRIYRIYYEKAFINALQKTLKRLTDEKKTNYPLNLNEVGENLLGTFKPLMRQENRKINWEKDSTKTIYQKILASDSSPGVLESLLGEEYYLFGAHPCNIEILFEESKRAEIKPKDIIAIKNESILLATRDGALWITHLKKRKSKTRSFPKLPAVIALEGKFDFQTTFKVEPSHEIKNFNKDTFRSRSLFEEFTYFEKGEIGLLHWNFLNGAMNSLGCDRLGKKLEWVKTRPTKILLLTGGEDFFSNGIDLHFIEGSENPASASLTNILAINRVVRSILDIEEKITISAIGGHAAAGGAFLSLSTDLNFAAPWIILNPHYKNMGNLYGSEYKTYLIPKKIDQSFHHYLAELRLPLPLKFALKIGFINEIIEAENFDDFIFKAYQKAEEFIHTGIYQNLVNEKRFFISNKNKLERDTFLNKIEEEEIKQMKKNFFGFDPSYHVARYRFVYRSPHSRTPLHLAKHRQK